jgi:hypothetical protein
MPNKFKTTAAKDDLSADDELPVFFIKILFYFL